jgi:hypothetical protein
VDYENIYSPDLKSRDNIFDMRRIDRQIGCVIAKVGAHHDLVLNDLL